MAGFQGRGRLVAMLAATAALIVVALIAAPLNTVSVPVDVHDGSLVRTTFESEVGVVLDEIPPSMRARATAALLEEPDRFWIERARSQLRLTTYVLVFRDAFYGGTRKALPLPPEPVWDVRLIGGPRRHRIDGHDVVGIDYAFSSVLLSGPDAPAESEPRLARLGGTWREPFVLPVDPELLFQRTGYACMDEAQYPFGSVDSENAGVFYDHTAVVEERLTRAGYHRTAMPDQSCVDALRRHVGRVRTPVRYDRLAWDPAAADRVRVGESGTDHPDLAAYEPEFGPSRTSYRYIHRRGSGGCEVAEKSVDGTGWRRLLQFATADENVGDRDLTIGGVDYFLSGEADQLDRHNLYEWSECHKHYHFKYYGDLTWRGSGSITNAKKGFCLQSTQRTANRETSPLHNAFEECGYQGVSAGWIDNYQAGLSGQWLDTTDLPAGPGTRSFETNPRGFLCEGRFVDAKGAPLEPADPVVWAPTGLTAANGGSVDAPLCEPGADWDANNIESVGETIERHGLGLITTRCTRGQIGPLRNCGFGEDPEVARCAPGKRTRATFTIPSGSAPQVVRLTEFSHALETAIPARYEESYVPLRPGVSDQPAMLANVVVGPDSATVVRFDCPAPRTGGRYEPGGAYGIYTAPVLPSDQRAVVNRR